jgi:hypothetical protein
MPLQRYCRARKRARDKMTSILHNMSVMLRTKLQLSTRRNRIILHPIALHLSSVLPGTAEQGAQPQVSRSGAR